MVVVGGGLVVVGSTNIVVEAVVVPVAVIAGVESVSKTVDHRICDFRKECS